MRNRLCSFDLSLISFAFRMLFYYLWKKKLKGKKTECEIGMTEAICLFWSRQNLRLILVVKETNQFLFFSKSRVVESCVSHFQICSGPSGSLRLVFFVSFEDVLRMGLGGWTFFRLSDVKRESWEPPESFKFGSFSRLRSTRLSRI